MYKWTKRSLVSLTILTMAAAPAAYAANNVNVAAKVQPKSGISLNFDSFSFLGAVGDANVVGAGYKLGAADVAVPNFSIRAKTGYTVYMSGDNLSAGGQQLNIQRMSVSVGNQTAKPIGDSNNRTTVDTGTGNGTIKLTQNVSFNLNLTDTDNSFTDNEVLNSLNADTDFTTTLTVSFTGA